MNRSRTSLAALVAVGTLVACGGEGESGPVGAEVGSSSAGQPGAGSTPDLRAGGSLAAEAVTGPALICAAPSFDFGTIWEGETVDHTFELAAAGGPVRIEAVRTSCGCTIPRLARTDGSAFAEGQTLEPGDALALNVRFSSLHRVGTHDRPITVYGNVSETGRFQVNLTGEVKPRLQASEEVADFGRLLAGQGARAELDVRSADGEPVVLLAPRATTMTAASGWPAGLDLELVPVDPDGGGRAASWTAILELGGGGEPAAFHWPVRLEIADGEGEYTGTGATIYARWQRVRPLEASPPRLSLGVLRSGVLASASVDLLANAPGLAPGDLDVGSATVAASIQGREVGEHLTLVLRPGEEGDRAVLEVVADGLPADLTGPLRGQVVLPVGREDQESLTIAIDGIVSAG